MVNKHTWRFAMLLVLIPTVALAAWQQGSHSHGGIAREDSAPTTQYQVYLAESDQPPFGNLEPLAILKTNPDGAGIVQAIGPLKSLAGISSSSSRPSRRFLIVTEIKDSSHVLLRQTTQSGKN